LFSDLWVGLLQGDWGVSRAEIAPRVIALIDLSQAGISHLQRLPASITRATICLPETFEFSSTTYVEERPEGKQYWDGDLS
jgi:hypothetical protein